ncbi:hypothetical protein TNCV_1933881 [Trichonephila clavipes]|nr:hypothetical protein TNCV_1933881 [Trichonephila clavipes]
MIEWISQGQTVKQQHYIEVKRKFRERSVEEVKAKEEDVKMVPPNEPQHCFQLRKIRMQPCIEREGKYVEVY